MGKDLKSLIRFSKWGVDEKRRALGEMLRREAEVVEAQDQLEAELRHEQQVAAADMEGIGMVYSAYAHRYMARREDLAQTLANVQGLIAKAQDELAEAYRELKTYEISQANREKRQREEEGRRDQAVLDEIGLNLHRRRQLAETREREE
ncbi:MAG: flagellar export protein FliJ [Alphaproteobacteria bacterium]